jgi:hypothetical protein
VTATHIFRRKKREAPAGVAARPEAITHPEEDAMPKLRLNVEALAVESFQAQPHAAEHAAGTVHAHANTQQVRCTYFCSYPCTDTGLPC